MDIVCAGWVLPGEGTDARCKFPANSDDRKVSKELTRRLKHQEDAHPDWPVWKIKIRGRSGKSDLFYMYMFLMEFCLLFSVSETVQEALDKLDICKTMESALTVSEAETVADQEALEIEKIRRRKLVRDAQQIVGEFSPDDEEESADSVASPPSKRSKGPRAKSVDTPT